jgi:TatD DNase family protein
MVFDAHVHFQLASAPTTAGGYFPPCPGLRALTCGVETADMEPAIERWGGTRPPRESGSDPLIRPFIGIHPWFPMEDLASDMDRIERLVRENPWVGIGEIGLDKHREENPLPLQERYLRDQLAIAKSYGRPANIHCVKAFGPLIAGLREFSSCGIPFLVHAYSGSRETARQIVDMGGYVSFAPFTIQRRSTKSVEVIRAIPVDRLLLDTDFPSFRGQGLDTYGGVLAALYADAAEILGMDREELIEQVLRNGSVFTD